MSISYEYIFTNISFLSLNFISWCVHCGSSVLGGEMSMVDSVMACLMPPPHLQKGRKLNLTPDFLMNRLRPLFGLGRFTIFADSKKRTLWEGVSYFTG